MGDDKLSPALRELIRILARAAMRSKPVDASTGPLNEGNAEAESLSAGVNDLPKLYTLPQVAEYLGVSERTVKRLIASRKLVGTRYGRTTRIQAEQLQAFLRAGTCPLQTSKRGTISEPTESGSDKLGSAPDTSGSRKAIFELAVKTASEEP